VLGFILVLANRRSVLGDAVNGRWFRKVAAATVVAIGALASVVVVQTVARWV
jgi:Mn2+/Fe2+ NRAMP family transporter